MKYFSIHNHCDKGSNLRLKDTTNKINKMVKYTIELGYKGFVLSDHESVSAHVDLLNLIKKEREKGNIPDDYKIGLGNEIYLVDREEVQQKRENNEPIKFYHFIMIALNRKGHDLMRKFSTQAWKNSFFYRMQERVPTYYDYLWEHKDEIRGNFVASTACLGSHLSQLILEYNEKNDFETKKSIHNLLIWCKNVFGDDNFYLELQPSSNLEQEIVNKMLLLLGEKYGLKCIISTDSHYLNKEEAPIHETFLKSDQDKDREVAAFYATTYFMSIEEIRSYFPYVSDEKFGEMMNNTMDIYEKIEEYSLDETEKLPVIDVPEYDLSLAKELFEGRGEFLDKYLNSPHEIDKYYISLIADGYVKKGQSEKYGQVGIDRIELELHELWEISLKIKQHMSQYFVVMKDIIDTTWETSLVGVGRGSAAGFYVNYLLDIVQINPIDFNLEHWRFLTKERPELADEHKRRLMK